MKSDLVTTEEVIKVQEQQHEQELIDRFGDDRERPVMDHEHTGSEWPA